MKLSDELRALAEHGEAMDEATGIDFGVPLLRRAAAALDECEEAIRKVETDFEEGDIRASFYLSEGTTHDDIRSHFAALFDALSRLSSLGVKP